MAPSDLGIRIRRARERRRWTQEQLAVKVGVGVRTVGRWERGTPPRSSIGALEQVLGIDLTGDSQPDPKLEELLAIIESMEPGQRDLWREAAQRISNGKHGREPARPERAG